MASISPANSTVSPVSTAAVSPPAPCFSRCGGQLALFSTARAEFDWDAQDVVVVGHSGGKDSSVCLETVCRQANSAGALHKVRVLHCDLGSTPGGYLIEWPGAAAIARRQAERYGVPFAIRRSSRWTSLYARILAHGKWPGFFARYCTSDLKTTVGRDYIDEVGRELNLRRPVRAGYALGMRAEESALRARKEVVTRHRMTARSKRIVDAWLPVHHLDESTVWSTIRDQALPYHAAYDWGMRRLSCRLCPLAARNDLVQSARLNPGLAAEYARTEAIMGKPFKGNLSMARIIEAANEAPDELSIS
ncbi:hypothetical protein GCM10022247_34780 [Allokutzneria multivorans]|uniref:Phosphoadenosine phosphosulphate reductase domain-containing protein n=1 Tax=Allokutzneria multivorans TaxID=1142134 RepID=A0ABP7SCF5_9PSEU